MPPALINIAAVAITALALATMSFLAVEYLIDVARSGAGP